MPGCPYGPSHGCYVQLHHGPQGEMKVISWNNKKEKEITTNHTYKQRLYVEAQSFSYSKFSKKAWSTGIMVLKITR